ncbi:MAG: hypothetical protein Q9217_002506 [Psora testacea]
MYPEEVNPLRRPAEPDVPLILSLIHELAAYEKASSSVEATESSLLRTLSFPSNPSQGYAKTLLLFAPPSHSSSSHPSTTTTTSTCTSPSSSSSALLPFPQCAGMALYFSNYSTWRAAPGIYLEDLYIRPEYRGRGYGTALLKELAREVQRMGGGRLEWSVLKWNEPSIRFYESEGVGATRMEEWVGMRVDGVALERLGGGGQFVGERTEYAAGR